MKKILIAVDEESTSEKVAMHGLQLAKQLKAEIALISVVDILVMITDNDVAPLEIADMKKSELKKNQQMLIEKVFKDYKVQTFIEEGNPYETILKIADEWEADLIVLGTHGRTGLSHLLMGSVAEKITRHSTKPLLIIPTK